MGGKQIRTAQETEAFLAELIARCDVDFRPVGTVSNWANSRANYIIRQLENRGLAILPPPPAGEG